MKAEFASSSAAQSVRRQSHVKAMASTSIIMRNMRSTVSMALSALRGLAPRSVGGRAWRWPPERRGRRPSGFGGLRRGGLVVDLELGVLGDELWHGLFHQYHHVGDVDPLGQGVELGHDPGGLPVVVGPDLGHEDAAVLRGDGVLFCGEHLLVELLPGAEPGVLYPDVAAHLQAGKVYHPLGKRGDLDRLAHVEHEYLGARGECRGLHHKAASLGDGHEEAAYLAVGHCDRAAVLYLLAEAGYDRAVGAENVAEAGGDELCLALRLPALYGEAERLDVDLGQALGAAHDVGGVDGLVGGDHDHLLHVILHALVGHLAGAAHVDPHGLAGVLLHEGHMLVGGGVEHNLRAVFAEHEVEPLYGAHVADHRHEVKLRERVLELEADVVERGLGVVKEHKLPDSERGKLAAELGAYRPGCPGHHYHLPREVGDDLVHRDLYLGAPEQVLYLYFPHVVAYGLPLGHLVDARGDVGLYAGLAAEVDEAVLLGARVGDIGEQHAVDVGLLGHIPDV